MIINLILILLFLGYIIYSEIQMVHFKKTMLNQNHDLVNMLNELRSSNEALKLSLLHRNEIIVQSSFWNTNFILGVIVFTGLCLTASYFYQTSQNSELTCEILKNNLNYSSEILRSQNEVTNVLLNRVIENEGNLVELLNAIKELEKTILSSLTDQNLLVAKSIKDTVLNKEVIHEVAVCAANNMAEFDFSTLI
jgi:hypothetical protein